MKSKKKTNKPKHNSATPKSTSGRSASGAGGKYGKSDLAGFKKILEKFRAHLSNNVTSVSNKTIGKNPSSDSGDLSTLPFHLADIGSDVFEHDMNLSIVESGSETLEDIVEALEKIENGSFGACELCRRPIPKERLIAIPYTKLCIVCKKKEEGV